VSKAGVAISMGSGTIAVMSARPDLSLVPLFESHPRNSRKQLPAEVESTDITGNPPRSATGPLTGCAATIPAPPGRAGSQGLIAPVRNGSHVQ
jgi:hypothetical protein